LAPVIQFKGDFAPRPFHVYAGGRMKTVRLLASFFVLLFALSCSSDSSTTAPPPLDPVVKGDITTWAGTGHAGNDGDGHDRQHTNFYWPMDIEFTPHIGVYVSDWNNHRIRQYGDDGLFHTVIGHGNDGDGAELGEVQSDLVAPYLDGTLCELNHPTSVFERSNGNLVIVCWHNHKLREYDPATKKVRVLVGRGNGCTGDGENITASDVLLNQPPHAIEGPDGSIYINDQRNQCIRKIDPAGVMSTVVGTRKCSLAAGSFGGDNGPPSAALLSQPTGSTPDPGGGLAFDAAGLLYIADTNNQRIRRVDFGADLITTVAGNGTAGFGGDGGDPLLASFNSPRDIAFGPDGRLFVADMENNRVRAIDFANNVITTVAGNGVRGFAGDRGPAVAARLNRPYGLGFDAAGDLYIADTYNQRIRRVKMSD
jgi:DNA-binding beta-propeller fold protein YncE